jgi:hypothetical protein
LARGKGKLSKDNCVTDRRRREKLERGKERKRVRKRKRHIVT